MSSGKHVFVQKIDGRRKDPLEILMPRRALEDEFYLNLQEEIGGI